MPVLAPLPNRKPTISRALPPCPRPNTTTTPYSSSSTVSHIPVARAGGIINPSSAAEVNPRDDTATRAIYSAAIKSAEGQRLFTDPTAGNFWENLIMVHLKARDGSAGTNLILLRRESIKMWRGRC